MFMGFQCQNLGVAWKYLYRIITIIYQPAYKRLIVVVSCEPTLHISFSNIIHMFSNFLLRHLFLSTFAKLRKET
jgi:hypothetical protein